MDDDIDQTEMSITELNESHRSAGSGGQSSSKGSNGGSIPSSPFNAPPKVSGWVEHKYTNISEHRLCEDWTLQWLALEGGFVFWYMNDTMGSPKGFKQLHGLEIGIQDHDTNDENIVVKLSDHNEIHEFCISKINSSIWTDAMYQNKKIGTQDDSATSLADYKMEDIDIALPASMQIHLKGAPHTLSVGPDDDTTKLTEDFVMLHNLKSDIKPRIESELLRTQVDSCIAYQSKLRSQISHLRRLVIENMTHEPRALAAEALASRTADEIIELSQITGDITNKMASLRAECDSKNKQIATLTGDLLKEQSAIYEYKLAATTQLENCQNEIEHLQRKLKFSKSQKTFDDPDVMLDAIETIENKSIMVESLKKQLQDKEKQLEHRDQRIEELLKSNKTLETDISKVERSLGECAEDNASLHLKIKEIRSTDQKTIDDLKRRVHEYDDGMKTLRKQLKTLTESEEHSRTTDQLNESKIKKLMEDCKRLTTSNHALIQKRELTAMGFEASRQENKSLQEQLKSAEDIVASFKSHSSTKLLRDVTAENNALKEQSIRLRGEVLALQAKIEEIESSAFSAVQSMQLLNPKSSGIPSSHAANHPPSDLLHSDDAGNEEEKVIVELILEEDSSESEYQSERKSTRERRLQNVVPQSSAYDEDECQETDVEVDLNLEQSFADTLTISEKSAAALSPIVEDRLLRNIYHKYTTETSELLTLSRFGRFTKEFKISALVKSSDKYNSSGMKKSEAMLVYGDVDVVFMNTIKNVPVLENDSPLNMSTGTNMTTSAGGSSPRSGAKAQRSFKPGGGKIRSPRTTAMTQIKGSHLSANQFIAAVQDLAVRLYSNVIEEKTGTVLECLPEKQKKMAMRAAMDVMVLKKLMPHASTLGLVPWELMFLDQTLTTIHTSEFASQSLVSHITKISAWFAHYAKLVEISIFSTPGKPMLHSSMSLPSSPTSYIGSPDINCRSPYGVSAGHVINAPEILTFRGISYKALSKFFHDYGVIPYLIKDSQLFSMFTEVNMWAKGNVELLLTALPKEVQELTAVALEMSNQPEVSAKLAKKKILLCGSFFVLFAAVASQAFDETPPERRIQRLFEWSAQSGGSYLMQRKKQFED